MTAAQTKERRRETYRNNGGDYKKSRKQGTNKSKKVVLKASMVTKLPVSDTKPSWGPYHTICHLLPALVDNSIKCHYGCREKINENRTDLPGLGGCSSSGSIY